MALNYNEQRMGRTDLPNFCTRHQCSRWTAYLWVTLWLTVFVKCFRISKECARYPGNRFLLPLRIFIQRIMYFFEVCECPQALSVCSVFFISLPTVLPSVSNQQSTYLLWVQIVLPDSVLSIIFVSYASPSFLFKLFHVHFPSSLLVIYCLTFCWAR